MLCRKKSSADYFWLGVDGVDGVNAVFSSDIKGLAHFLFHGVDFLRFCLFRAWSLWSWRSGYASEMSALLKLRCSEIERVDE